MSDPDPALAGHSGPDGVSLRLLWPQWQGAGTSSVRELAPEFPFGVARRGYATGSAVLEAVLPPHDGPTAVVPVTLSDDGLGLRDASRPRRSFSISSRPHWRSSAAPRR